VDESTHNQQVKIYTIGHSNQRLDSFLNLLVIHGIQLLADVRSVPHSKIARQFDTAPLNNSLKSLKIAYYFLGQELGGKPNKLEYYDVEGYALYYLMAQAPSFINAIERLIQMANKNKTAIMCVEENPLECHRRLLISRILSSHGIEELHIRGNGQLQTETEISGTRNFDQEGFQFNLFGMQQEEIWRSAKPIRLDSPNTPRNNFSER